MIGLEQVRNRLKILDSRSAPIKAELDALAAQPETPENVVRFNQLAQALQIMIGRRMECEAWIEVITAYPGVSQPEQLPTKANTPAYVPITEKVAPEIADRFREQHHRRDADELTALLPDAQ